MCNIPLNVPSYPPDFVLTFPPHPRWVRTCRETVRTSTLALRDPDLTEVAVLLTSEATTNAITACTRAACTYPITLYGERLDTSLFRIHIYDAAPGVPSAHNPGPQTDHGRGVRLIEKCASRYGLCVDGPGPGKWLWFQLEGDRH